MFAISKLFPPKLKKVLAKVRKLKSKFKSYYTTRKGESNDRKRTEEINYTNIGHSSWKDCAGTGQDKKWWRQGQEQSFK
jgi:hypothetical protein